MKFLILLCLLAFIATSSIAQDTIANPGFEYWTQEGGYTDPNIWNCENPLTSIIGQITCKQDSVVVHSGKYSCNLVTTFISSILTTSTINAATGQLSGGGANINSRPLSVNGWFQYVPAGADTANVTVKLISGNMVVGQGVFYFTDTVKVWTTFTCNITYTSNTVPDTAQITFQTSINAGANKSSLWLDDISYSYTVTNYCGSTQITDSFSMDSSYNFNGRILTSPGQYTDTIPISQSCDSIVYLNLVQLPFPQTAILYGMTPTGGTNNLGTIFRYNTTTGLETVLHSFGSGLDGASPQGSLYQATNHLVYGMTEGGGQYRYGTIFSYDITNDSETVLYSFGNGNDGKYPVGSFIQADNGLLYGTTFTGGSNFYNATNGDGTIFSYNIRTGVENVIYNFGNNDTDGMSPRGSLIQITTGLLAGTTLSGMSSNCYGTVFNYNISTGKEITQCFDGADGASPQGSLVQDKVYGSLLYGTTYGYPTYNFGTLFSYNANSNVISALNSPFGGPGQNDAENPTGSLIQSSNNGLLYGSAGGIILSYNIAARMDSVLYNFNSGAVGRGPCGSLWQTSNGYMYGTTQYGGVNQLGTIFSYNILTGTEMLEYSFGNDSDGTLPVGDLIEVHGYPTSIPSSFAKPTQLQISPNPSTGQFIIQLPGNQSNYPTEVYDMLGQKVEQLTLSNSQNTINLSNQPTGMYFVYVQTENGTAMGKVVVTK